MLEGVKREKDIENCMQPLHKPFHTKKAIKSDTKRRSDKEIIMFTFFLFSPHEMHAYMSALNISLLLA